MKRVKGNVLVEITGGNQKAKDILAGICQKTVDPLSCGNSIYICPLVKECKGKLIRKERMARVNHDF